MCRNDPTFNVSYLITTQGDDQYYYMETKNCKITLMIFVWFFNEHFCQLQSLLRAILYQASYIMS